jgi:hypothetical protein
MRFLLIGAFIGLWASAAQACEGQKGKVLYEDTFADDSGGWPSYKNFIMKAPGAEVRDIQPGTATRIINQTFSFNQADYCLEVVLPPNDPNTRQYEVSVAFLSNAVATEQYAAMLSNTGVVTLSRSTSSPDLVSIWSVDQKSIANLTSGSSNSIEAIVKGSTISVLLNGKLVKTIRAQIPNGDFRFGFDLDVNPAAPPGVFTIKSIKVTEAQ